MKIIFPKIKLSIERWKWNENYQIYVSTSGRIRNKKKKIIPIKISQGHGYVKIELPSGLIKALHRIVLETWNPVEGMENLTVDHKDHNCRNNNLDNLEWMSLEKNQELAEQDLIKDCSKQLNPNQLMNDNLGKPIIRCGSRIFNSYDEIIYFLIDKKKINNDNIIKKNIKNNIIKSIKQNKKYCNYLFELK